jgi:hypothetical protein
VCVCVCVSVQPSVKHRMSSKGCELYITFRKRDMKFYSKAKEHVEKEQNVSNTARILSIIQKTPVRLCNCGGALD